MKKTGYVLFTRGIKEYKVKLSKFLHSSRAGLYEIIKLSNEEIKYQIDQSVDMVQIINCDFSVLDCERVSIILKANSLYYDMNDFSSKSIFVDKVNFGDQFVQIQCADGTIECDTVEAKTLFLEGNSVNVSNIEQVSMSIHADCVNVKEYTVKESHDSFFVLARDVYLEDIYALTMGEIQISYKYLSYRNLLLTSPSLYMQNVFNSYKMDRIGIWTIDDEKINQSSLLPENFSYLQKLYNTFDTAKQYSKKNTK